MRGGIGRAAAQVAQARGEGVPVAFVAGGNSLFGRSPLTEIEAPQERRKAEALATAFRTMHLDLFAPGPLDDAAGVEFRKSLRLPELEGGETFVLNLGGRVIAITTAPIVKARTPGASFLLALLPETFEQALKASSNADAAVATRMADEFAGEENRVAYAAPPVVQIQSKGRSLLRVDLFFGGAGDFAVERSSDDVDRQMHALDQRIEVLKREIDEPGQNPELKKMRQQKLDETIDRRRALAEAPPATLEGKNAFTMRFVPLETSLPSSPEVDQIVKAYDDVVAKLNVEWARQHGPECPRGGPGEPVYTGSARCRECHEEAFAVWEKTPHMRGYQTLVTKGKQFHLNCIGCHVTGFEKPGGVCRIDRVGDRQGVGCESCHGPGSRHADDPDVAPAAAKPKAAECVGCHNAENSPHFDFSTYLPQILGPGHGKPVAKK
jgi:hypothetical protein